MQDMLMDLPLMDGLAEFMRAALNEGKEDGVLRYPVKAGGITLNRPSSKDWELILDGMRQPFTLVGGEWLEKFTAVAFARAGAEHVRARVRMNWNETNEALARKAAARSNQDGKDSVFRLDLDVIGSWGSDLFLVSCKSNPNTDIDGPSVEALHTGANLGRFRICILAHMGCPKAFVHDTGVLVLGWRELCQPEVLHELFQQMQDRARTA